MANNIHIPAKALKKSTVLDLQSVATALINEPDLLYKAEVERDAARIAYDTLLVELSVGAMAAEIFAGKDGAKRAAANDTERKLAVDQALAASNLAIELRANLDRAQREITLHRGRLESYQLIARLLIAQPS